MARSALMKFRRLLADARYTGSPSRLTGERVRQMAKAIGLLEPEAEAVLRGGASVSEGQ